MGESLRRPAASPRRPGGRGGSRASTSRTQCRTSGARGQDGSGDRSCGGNVTERGLCICTRGHNCGVQFSPDLRERVAEGTITVSYRLWSRPKVKVGGIYASGSVTIEVDEIELQPFSSITAEDLARTGEPDLETLRARAAHAGPVHDDTRARVRGVLARIVVPAAGSAPWTVPPVLGRCFRKEPASR
jgi:hypothetical protein